jgi:N-acetylglucosamine-6-phosphate deacetylase
MPKTLFVGVDGGGTACRIRIVDRAGRRVAEAAGGPANVRFAPAALMANIVAMAGEAMRAAGRADDDLRHAHAGLGLAGAMHAAAVEELLAARHPFASVAVETDAYIAWLGAHGGEDGGIVILGTGSCAFAVVDRRQVVVGGYGAEISDEASGHWLGREVIRRALWAMDGRAASSPLAQAVLDRLGGSGEAAVAFATAARPADYARFAPLVCDFARAGDPLGTALIKQAAADAARLIERLFAAGAPRVALLGGLAEALAPHLPPELRTRLVPARGDALDGAIQLARRQHSAPHRPARAAAAPLALVGARIFDGETMLDGHAVLVDGARIAAIVPEDAIGSTAERQPLAGLLAPGFLDVQVNGGGGVLFNDSRSVEGIAAIAAAHRRFGTVGLLPTFISAPREETAEALAAARAAVASVPGVLGVHIEGPFLNPARAGAHDRHFLRTPDEDDLHLLTVPAAGVTLVTLAPECVPPAWIARLVEAGVVVSAGHTEATPEVFAAARRAGLRGVTHLFNAMPPLAGRAPGPIGATLGERETWCGLIADLHHVAAESLALAVAAKGRDRIMLVTDAMPTVGSADDSFLLQGRRVTRRDGRLTMEEGTLAGSNLDMAGAVRNAVRQLGVPLADALRMASLTPAAFLRLDGVLGRIAPGYRASLVLLDDALVARATWIDGVEYAVAEAARENGPPLTAGQNG